MAPFRVILGWSGPSEVTYEFDERFWVKGSNHMGTIRARQDKTRRLRTATTAAVEMLESRILFFGTAPHIEITATALSFFNDSVLTTVNAQHQVQDKVDPNGDIAAYHFDGCYFNEGATTINSRYQTILNNANPNSFNSNTMAVEFGKLMHATQDFYAHSNWVEDSKTSLAQPGLGLWDPMVPYSFLDGVMVIEGESQTPNVSPYGTAHFSRNGHVTTV